MLPDVYFFVLLNVNFALIFYGFFRVYFFDRRKRKQLHDAYRHTGVTLPGVILKVNERESHRTYEIIYGYMAPGTDILFVKGLLEYGRRRPEQRCFRVKVLPGQPESGVPECKVQCIPPRQKSPWDLAGLVFFAIVFGICDLLCYLALTFSLNLSILLGSVTTFFFPFLGAYISHCADLRGKVPGRVLQQIPRENVPGWVLQQIPLSSSRQTLATDVDITVSHEEDVASIPIAEAMAILDQEPQEVDANDSAAGVCALDSPSATATDDGSLPTAKPLEIVSYII